MHQSDLLRPCWLAQVRFAGAGRGVVEPPAGLDDGLPLGAVTTESGRSETRDTSRWGYADSFCDIFECDHGREYAE